MKNTLSIISALVLLTIMISFKSNENGSFIKVENGEFIKNGNPYTYIGANFWYGAILASEGEGGNRERLLKELDLLKDAGIDNLRILVGSDGENGVKSKVEPTLQIAPGVYNDTILDGLDFLLCEMGKRDMSAVLYLNNSWEWSGGYSQYLEWAGHGKAPVPAIDGWNQYMDYVKEFPQSEPAKQIFNEYVIFIITRTNRYTNKKYTDDTAIMSWQIGNEPRAFSVSNKELFAVWIADVAKLIKSIDKNHLVSTGSEGKHGCEQDIVLYEKIHSDKNIDYLNIHIWPYNWGWVSKDSLFEKLENARDKSLIYIEEHYQIAKKYNKPIVLEEFGFPRDGFSFSKDSTTVARDIYYDFIFNMLVKSNNNKRMLNGCNFWAWGGYGEPQNLFWQKGDDYTGDPAQEEQGLNSVFSTDNTLEIIKNSNVKIYSLN